MATRAEVLNTLLPLTQAACYLEIGVSLGETFDAIEAPRKVAVDPAFLFNWQELQSDTTQYYDTTSDVYFATACPPGQLFDLIYLDGLHTAEQTFRDLCNSLSHLAADGILVVDDVLPNSYDSSLRSEQDALFLKQHLGNQEQSWMGDTYRIVPLVQTFMPTLALRTVSDNHGQAVIWRTKLPRATLPEIRLAEIASWSFLDVVRQRGVFEVRGLESIVREIELERSG